MLPNLTTRAQQFWSGVRAEIPLLVGVFPFGMIYGLLALQAGLTQAQAQGMSSIVFAGSAQFITTQLVSSNTPSLVIVLTILVVNLRHALYSASIAPFIQHLPQKWKFLLAYFLTDEAYAIAITEYEQQGVTSFGHWFFLGAGVALWTIWQISSAVGIFLGATIPAEWSLDFALALTFIAIVVPLLKDRASTAAALSAGLVALAAYQLPYKLGLIVAALVGIAVGVGLEQRK